MPNLIQYSANLQRAIAELRATREAECSLIIHDEIALMKSRVINQGVTATGGSLTGRTVKLTVATADCAVPSLAR